MATEALWRCRGCGNHADGDRLNNVRANLRVTTHGGNQQNRRGGYGSSRYRGVQLHRDSGKWRARARLNGREYHLGTYADEREAARVAAAWRAEHMSLSSEAAQGAVAVLPDLESAS